jgi:hypothetical protein
MKKIYLLRLFLYEFVGGTALKCLVISNISEFSVEKKCELDRLTAEAAALTKLEAENHEFIEQFILQK